MAKKKNISAWLIAGYVVATIVFGLLGLFAFFLGHKAVLADRKGESTVWYVVGIAAIMVLWCYVKINLA